MRGVVIVCICSLVVVAWGQTDAPDGSRNGGTDGACTNPRGTAGRCVQFQECEHSTDHVDLRLYRPRNYTSVCVSPEICCPLQYISAPVQADPNAPQWDNFD